MFKAARSFIEPPGLNHSAFAYIDTFGEILRVSRFIFIKGVLPILFRIEKSFPAFLFILFSPGNG